MFNTKLLQPLSMVALLLLCAFTPAFSQEKIWEVDLKESLYEVGWIKQANDGTVIAAGAKGLIGLNNNSGETVWHNKELKGVDKNSFLNIDGLPLFYVDYAPMLGKTRGLLIDASNGDVVFDTKDGGYRIKTYTIFPEQGAILFEMLNGSERALMKFSLKDWKSEWIAALGTPKGLIGKAMDIASSASFIDQGPMFSKGGKAIIGIKSQIYAIDMATGKVSWDMTTDKKIKALVHSDLNNSVYVGVRKSKTLTVLDGDSGKDITPGKLKLKGTLLDIRPDGNGKLVLVETEGFNLIDPKSNDLIWKKSYKIAYLDEVIPYKGNFLAVGKSEKDGSISMVDKDGKKVWDGKVKGYSYYVTPTPKGVMYISTQRSNILGYDDGKDVWDKDVKFKSIPAVTYDDKEDKVVLFENKKGYKFDLNSGKVTQFAEDIELKEVKKTTPLLAESVDAGYFIFADQHTSLLTRDGKLAYTEYYEPIQTVDLTTMAQIGMNFAGVDVDVAGAMQNMETLSMLANGAYRGSADQSDAKTKSKTYGAYVNNSPVMEITTTRYKNSRSTKDNMFIVAKLPGGSEYYILMVNKNSGEVAKKIKLDDKTPNYFIDEIDNRVFLNEKSHNISGYGM